MKVELVHKKFKRALQYQHNYRVCKEYKEKTHLPPYSGWDSCIRKEKFLHLTEPLEHY